MAVLCDYIYLMDEMTCVNGTVPFMDVSNYSLKTHTAISLEERKDFAETWQVSLDKFINFKLNICEPLVTFFIELLNI